MDSPFWIWTPSQSAYLHGVIARKCAAHQDSDVCCVQEVLLDFLKVRTPPEGIEVLVERPQLLDAVNVQLDGYVALGQDLIGNNNF